MCHIDRKGDVIATCKIYAELKGELTTAQTQEVADLIKELTDKLAKHYDHSWAMTIQYDK